MQLEQEKQKHRKGNANQAQADTQAQAKPGAKATAKQKRKKKAEEAAANAVHTDGGNTPAKGGGKGGKSRDSSAERKTYTPEQKAAMKEKGCWLNHTKLNGGWTRGFRPTECFFSHKVFMNAKEFAECRVPDKIKAILTKGGKPIDFKTKSIERERLARDGGDPKGGKG